MVIGAFSMAVSLTMFGIGTYSERFGVRKAMLAGMVIILLGRMLLPGATWLESGLWIAVAVLGGLAIVAVGEGVLQAANYSGCKQYSDERRSAAAFGLNYGLFNLGILIVGFASPLMRMQWTRPWH